MFTQSEQARGARLAGWAGRRCCYKAPRRFCSAQSFLRRCHGNRVLFLLLLLGAPSGCGSGCEGRRVLPPRPQGSPSAPPHRTQVRLCGEGGRGGAPALFFDPRSRLAHPTHAPSQDLEWTVMCELLSEVASCLLDGVARSAQGSPTPVMDGAFVRLCANRPQHLQPESFLPGSGCGRLDKLASAAPIRQRSKS